MSLHYGIRAGQRKRLLRALRQKKRAEQTRGPLGPALFSALS
jgi:hypothetical protein